MGFLDTVKDFLPGVSSALSFISAERANDASRAASAEAFNRDYGAYKTRYQDTVADMKSAGLNPILAASGGFNVGNSVTANMPQTFQADYPDLASSAKDIAQAKLSEKQSAKTDKETKHISEQIKKTKKETLEVLARTKQLGKQSAKLAKETENLGKLYEKLTQEVRKVTAEADSAQVKAEGMKLLNTVIKGWQSIDDIINSSEVGKHVLKGIEKYHKLQQAKKDAANKLVNQIKIIFNDGKSKMQTFIQENQ